MEPQNDREEEDPGSERSEDDHYIRHIHQAELSVLSRAIRRVQSHRRYFGSGPEQPFFINNSVDDFERWLVSRVQSMSQRTVNEILSEILGPSNTGSKQVGAISDELSILRGFWFHIERHEKSEFGDLLLDISGPHIFLRGWVKLDHPPTPLMSIRVSTLASERLEVTATCLLFPLGREAGVQENDVESTGQSSSVLGLHLIRNHVMVIFWEYLLLTIGKRWPESGISSWFEEVSYKRSGEVRATSEPEKESGRDSDELYDQAFNEMQTGSTREQAFKAWLAAIVGEKGEIYIYDIPKYRDRFRHAMDYREKKQKEKRRKLD